MRRNLEGGGSWTMDEPIRKIELTLVPLRKRLLLDNRPNATRGESLQWVALLAHEFADLQAAVLSDYLGSSERRVSAVGHALIARMPDMPPEWARRDGRYESHLPGATRGAVPAGRGLRGFWICPINAGTSSRRLRTLRRNCA